MKKLIKVYHNIFKILLSQRPGVVWTGLLLAVLSGLMSPLLVWMTERLLNQALAVAGGSSFWSILPYLVIYLGCVLLPDLFAMLQQTYVEPNSELAFQTALKGQMLQKLKTMEYQHYEREDSREIIERTYDRAEHAAIRLFPKYFCNGVRATLATVGTLLLFIRVAWWLPVTLLLPFVIERYRAMRHYFDIFELMDSYWEEESRYEHLEELLRSRETVAENRLLQASDYLVNVYQNRLARRNREYERYYFLNLKKHFGAQVISRVGQLLNALLLLGLFAGGQFGITQLIALTAAVFTTLSNDLSHFSYILQGIPMHLRAFDYCKQYFALSEDQEGEIDTLPREFSIEFDHVSFAYPGTERQVLKDLTFRIADGEKVSIVGANGEGKTTLTKLLLGLFQPDSGEIRVGGRPIGQYTRRVREQIFGTVFQDFNRYNISLYENIAVGNAVNMSDAERVQQAMKDSGVDTFAERLPQGTDTILGRDFEGGVDLSGGQWQRIAIARALAGDKPVLILDEPTSQLDPMAESRLYEEFARMAAGRTALMISHRLGSTRITQRILVIAGGQVAEQGSHEQLLAQGGLYQEMWEAQRQWYSREEEAE